MSRSSKKGPFVEERLMSRIEAMNATNEKRMIRTWSRTSTIFPEMVGHTIAVHDGRKHVPVFVSEQMVGDELVIAAAYADEGPTLKRHRPRARGRVARIFKRTCHITIVLGESDQPTQRRRRRAAPPAQAEAPAPEAAVEKPKRAQRAKKEKEAVA